MASVSTYLDYEGKKLFRDFKAHIKEKNYEPPSQLSLKTAKKVYSCFRRTLKRYKINEEYEHSLHFYKNDQIITIKFCFQDVRVVFEVKDDDVRVSIMRFIVKPIAWDDFNSHEFFTYERFIDEVVKKIKNHLLLTRRRK